MEQLKLNLWPSLEELIGICESRYNKAKPVGGSKDLAERYIWFIKEKSWEIHLSWLYLGLLSDKNSEYRLMVIESGRMGSKVLIEYVQRGDDSEIGKLYNLITELKRPYQPPTGLRTTIPKEPKYDISKHCGVFRELPTNASSITPFQN